MDYRELRNTRVKFGVRNKTYEANKRFVFSYFSDFCKKKKKRKKEGEKMYELYID